MQNEHSITLYNIVFIRYVSMQFNVGGFTGQKGEETMGCNNDLISREALKKSLNFVYDCAYIDSKSKEGIVSDIIDEIDNAPNNIPQAEWLYFEGVSTSGYLECSKCGETDFHKKYSNFCPNCGKYMKNRKGGAE